MTGDAQARACGGDPMGPCLSRGEVRSLELNLRSSLRVADRFREERDVALDERDTAQQRVRELEADNARLREAAHVAANKVETAAEDIRQGRSVFDKSAILGAVSFNLRAALASRPASDASKRDADHNCLGCGRALGDGCARDDVELRVGCYLLGGPLRPASDATETAP